MELLYLWNAYFKIRRRKGSPMGIEPVGYQDVVGYSQAMRLNLKPWEIDTIISLDDMFLSEVSRQPE